MTNIKSLERAKQQWESAADSLPQFICLLDRDARLIRANRTIERWKLGIDVEAVAGVDLHELLHHGCDNASCYLKRFVTRAMNSLAKGRRANCDAWDPLLKRHFLIRARTPLPSSRRNTSLREVIAVVTFDDVTEFKLVEKESATLDRVLDLRARPEQAKQAQVMRVRSRVVDTLDNTPHFFGMADADGVLYYLNPAGRAMLGLQSQEESYGLNLFDCHAPREREQLLHTAVPAARREGSWSGESVLVARDGREIRTTLVIIAHHDDDGRLAGFSVQERDMSEWVRAEEASYASQRELRHLAAQHLAVQETERRRIAADLHDGIGQSLSLLKIAIQSAVREMDSRVPVRTRKSVNLLLPKVDSLLNELHRIAMDLRPSTLDDLGILPTLSWFVREFESANLKTRIEKHISVGEKDVPEPLKIAIFRILQEAVNNAVKYADAERISISLHNGGDVLAFTVEDNGRGFNADAPTPGDDIRVGLGMQSMRERAEVSGGVYAVSSAVGQGTKVCVWWPASKAAADARGPSGCTICGQRYSTTLDGVEIRSCYCTEAERKAGLEDAGTQAGSGGKR